MVADNDDRPKQAQRVNEELYKRNAELAVRNKTLALLRKLDEISLAAVQSVEMAQKITAAIATELGYEIVSLAIVDTQADTLRWLAIASPIPEIAAIIQAVAINTLSAPLKDRLASVHALEESNPHTVTNLQEVFPPAFTEALRMNSDGRHVENSIVYPLRFGNEVLGILSLSASRDLKNLSRYEYESLSGILGLVSLALYKAKIYEDLQRTSAQLEDANEQLKGIDKAKSEFLSVASHQLYTPLTAIRGYLSMLTDGDYGKIPSQQQPVIEIIEKSAVRLITLIKDLLDIQRIESGRLELNLESMDLVTMADTLVKDLMPNAMNKKLKLDFVKAEKIPHVVADAQRLRQVVLNIVDNAIKYTDTGSVKVNVAAEGDEVVLAVTDTGKGITQEEIKRLFNKFTRVGGASRYHTEGAGLGLFVAKQMVQEHHGEVTVTSPGLGKGSTFTIRLPSEGTAKSLKLGTKVTIDIQKRQQEQEKGVN